MSEMVSTELLWIGRFTGPKGELAEQIIHELAPAFAHVRFIMVGGPLTDALKINLPANVELTGFVENIQPYLQRATGVIGAGRVALEAMQAGKPILAVGENHYHGWISDENIDAAKATNFGDCDKNQPIDINHFKSDIERFLNGQLKLPLENYRDYLADYNPERVYQSVMQVYREAGIDRYLKKYREIPVLTYHRVVMTPPTNSRVNMYVTVDDLEEQILSLKMRGYETVTFKEIADGRCVKKPVIISFDDGYADNYQNLLSLLQKHNARAVIYTLANRQLKNNLWDMKSGEPEWPLMNDKQLQECHDSGLIEIGSHGINHQHLPQLSDQEVQQEIYQSKEILEEVLSSEIVSFAYPYGDYSEREARLVKDAGYLFGIGTVNGPVQAAMDRYRIRRITMFPNTKPMAFRKKTSGWYLRYCKLKGKDF